MASPIRTKQTIPIIIIFNLRGPEIFIGHTSSNNYIFIFKITTWIPRRLSFSLLKLPRKPTQVSKYIFAANSYDNAQNRNNSLRIFLHEAFLFLFTIPLSSIMPGQPLAVNPFGILSIPIPMSQFDSSHLPLSVDFPEYGFELPIHVRVFHNRLVCSLKRNGFDG